MKLECHECTGIGIDLDQSIVSMTLSLIMAILIGMQMHFGSLFHTPQRTLRVNLFAFVVCLIVYMLLPFLDRGISFPVTGHISCNDVITPP